MALKTLPLLFVWALVACLPLIHAQEFVDGSKCNCYLSNGSDPVYYVHRKFYDFRALLSHVRIPPLLQDPKEASSAKAANTYLTSDEFASFWELQSWNNSASLGPESAATVLRVNSLNNVYIEGGAGTEDSPTFMTLRTARQAMFQSSAELVTPSGGFQYVSMRMRARTIGAPGACTAMFTYRDPDPGTAGQLQETDLEVLTKYPKNQVQCTNQPSLDKQGEIIKEATQNVTLPDARTWDQWLNLRLDWTPNRSTWYVNGQQVANISFQVPRDPARLHLNAWSDGSPWTGAMAFNTEAYLQVQWWEVLYNSTEKKPTAPVCKAVCGIDGPAMAPGKVLMISNSLAPAKLVAESHGALAWVPVVVALVLGLGMV